MLYYSNKKKNSGFTLIEIMVVVAIVGILATIAAVNMGRNPDRDVRLEADRFSTFLRDVQGKALISEKPSKASAASCYSGNNWTCGKVCGFGVHGISVDSKIAEVRVYFVVTSGANKLNDSCSGIVNTYPGDDKNISGATFYLKNSVKINDFKDIFFLSPNGEVYSDGTLLGSQETKAFTFTKDSTVLGNAISVSSAGLIK